LSRPGYWQSLFELVERQVPWDFSADDGFLNVGSQIGEVEQVDQVAGVTIFFSCQFGEGRGRSIIKCGKKLRYIWRLILPSRSLS
jgi:hypothetical protein